MEKKCRSCGASTELRDRALFSFDGVIMPAEARLCPQCEVVSIFVVEDLGDDGAPAADLPAFCARRLKIEKHGGLIEVICPRCDASMCFVQHLHASFRGADILAESWACECGTALEIAKDPDMA